MPTTPALTKATLDAARRQGEKPAVTALKTLIAKKLGLSDRELPFVGIVVPSDPSAVGGRFFPLENAILVYKNEDPEVTAATISHEMGGHWASYQKRCGGLPENKAAESRCEYQGQHDLGTHYVVRDANGKIVDTARSLAAAHRKSRRAVNANAKVSKGKAFYDTLETSHRAIGISPTAARTVEGSYEYPEHWRNETWN